MSLLDNVAPAPRKVMTLFYVVDTSGSMCGSKIGSVNIVILMNASSRPIRSTPPAANTELSSILYSLYLIEELPQLRTNIFITLIFEF